VAAKTGLVLPPVVAPTPAQDAARGDALRAERTTLEARDAQLKAIPESQRTTDQKKELTAVENRLASIGDDLDDLLRYQSIHTDVLNGDGGDDTLFGSPFNDTLRGEEGSDTFVQSDLGQFGGDIIVGGTNLTGPENDTFAIRGTA